MPQIQRNLRSRMASAGIRRPAATRPAAVPVFGLVPAAASAAAAARATATQTAGQFATVTTTQRAIAAPVNTQQLIQDISMGEASPSALVFVTDPVDQAQNREFRTVVKGVLG